MPATATIGIAIKPNDRLALMFDWQEIWYSDVGAVGNPIQNLFMCPTAGFGGTDFEGCLGGNRGGGFGWDDMTVYKFGASYRLDDTWTLRGGYSFTDQPIPKDQMTFNILAPAVMEDHFSVGFTKKQAGIKVGEATVQVSGYYFSKVLELEEHLMREHFLKYNLRFFWPTTWAPSDG